MSTTSASSLFLPSLNPKTLALFNSTSRPSSFSLLSSASRKLDAKPISVSTSLFRSFHPLPSCRFVTNVAVSSEYDQEEDVLSDEEGANFSPDLKLFVGNLSFNVDSAQLAGLFETAGNVEMVEVIYDKVTGRSRGFAFVTMSSIKEVEAAAQKFNGYELDGRPLRVNFGPPPPKREEFSSRGPRGGGGGGGGGGGNRVYVGNLSWGVDDMALETLFRKQGKVVEAKVVYDRDSGRSRGFGFVTYASAQEVENAVDSLNGVDLDGRSIRVSVAEARPPRRSF